VRTGDVANRAHQHSHLILRAGVRHAKLCDARHDLVSDSIQHGVLRGNVAVQRNDSAAERGCQARHRECFDALGLNEPDRDGDDAFAG